MIRLLLSLFDREERFEDIGDPGIYLFMDEQWYQ